MPTRRPEQKERTKETSSRSAGLGPFTMDDLKALLASLAGTDVTSLEWDRGAGGRIAIQRGQPAAMAQVIPHMVPAPLPVAMPASAAPAGAAATPKAETKPGVIVTSPFVGTFYRSPSPEAPPFVELGTVIKKGQVLCIVEAMKLMNEIEAETAGKIAEIFVQNATPVEFGEPLFRVEPV